MQSIMENLPNFLICGAQKSGTTTLYKILKKHPQIFMSRKKELHFFTLEFDKGVDWYKKKFIEATNGKYKAIGEASPSYMYLENAPERIYSIIPNAKLIFILRNPVDRANSHYWMSIKKLRHSRGFEKALEFEDNVLKNCDIETKRQTSYKDRGKYSIQIKRFMEFFPDDQMLFLDFDQLTKNPSVVFNKIYDFLEVNTYNNFNYKIPEIHSYQGSVPYSLTIQSILTKIPWNLGRRLMKLNLRKGIPHMNHETRKMLIEYFKPYNKDLEQMLGMKFDWDK